MKRIDERDVLFARLRYREGSPDFKDYYDNHPEKRAIDDELRASKTFGSEGTMSYDSVISPFPSAAFDILAQMHHLVNGPVAPIVTEVAAEDLSVHIKKFALFLGAAEVGLTAVKPEYYYSHKGRNGRYGEPIDNRLPHAIAFLVEMDEGLIDRAPQVESAFAVTKGYMDAAIIGVWIAQYLRNLGYEAVAHMDGNYEVNCSMVAEGAGLGEIGRIGILVNPKMGPRVRIGVVTTNAPLIPDEIEPFYLNAFCEVCGKCAKTCPGKAISDGPSQILDGFEGWNTDQEACYRVWTRLGTDCGVCLSTCPFSHHLPLEQIGKWKGESELIHTLLETHQKMYGIRPYIKQKLPLITV